MSKAMAYLAWLGPEIFKPGARARQSQKNGLAWPAQAMAWLGWLLALSQGRQNTNDLLRSKLEIENQPFQDYEGDSGSSMATPLVSGVIAAILSEQGPTTPASMKELLLTEYVTVGAVRNVPPKSPDRLLLAAKLWPKVL
ncbi:hypothetical protein R3P38DRAFT_3479556 [Favolaschia claudopus]|uniref:Peptidase S8/S53 domain-containing protein n=1 Tax=Favolaschia claudopus TaxID=2862362 RepID=A0AAV9Z978_9AGAR